ASAAATLLGLLAFVAAVPGRLALVARAGGFVFARFVGVGRTDGRPAVLAFAEGRFDVLGLHFAVRVLFGKRFVGDGGRLFVDLGLNVRAAGIARRGGSISLLRRLHGLARLLGRVAISVSAATTAATATSAASPTPS